MWERIELWWNNIETQKPEENKVISWTIIDTNQRIKDIQKQEEIDKYIDSKLKSKLDDLWIEDDERSDIISKIINKYWKNKEWLNSLLDAIIKDESLMSNDDFLHFIDIYTIHQDNQETHQDNQKTIQVIDKKQEKVEETEEKVEVKKEKVEKTEENLSKEYNDVKEILKSLNNWPNKQKYQNLLKLVNGWDIKWAINELKNPKILTLVANDLKQQSPENYETFKSSLIQIDSSFIESFDNIEKPNFPNKLDQVKLWVSSENWIEYNWDKLSISKDWADIEYEDWTRKIWLTWWRDYKMLAEYDWHKNNIDMIKNIKEKFEIKIDSINKEIKSLLSILDFIENAKLNNKELVELKKQIKINNSELYNELNLDNYTTYDDIKRELEKRKKDKEEEKSKVMKEAEFFLQKTIKQNSEEAKEKDEKKKKLLEIFKKVSYDIFPKSVTDMLINHLKINWISIPWLDDINIQNIDIEWKWTFWESWAEELWDKRTINIIHFVEKIIYWVVWSKDSIYSWKNFLWVFWSTINPTEMKYVLEKNRIKTNLWWNINKMKKNLMKKV